MSPLLRGWVCALLLGAAPSLAAPKKMSEAELEKAAARFDEADKLYQKGEYARALGIYQDLYLNTEEPLLLFNIGQCQRKLARYPEAAESFRSFIARGKGYEQLPLAKELLREVEAAASAQPPAGARDTKVLPFALFGGAGLSVAAGGVLGFVALRSAEEASTLQQDPASEVDEIQAASTRARRLSITADALYLLGVASGVGGLLLLRKGGSSAEPAATLSLSPAGAAVSLRF